MGGLSKKAFQFEKAAIAANMPALKVDAGNLLFKYGNFKPSQKKQQKNTARGIAEAYSLIGYDAVGISGQDLAAGLDFIKELEAATSFSWLSANLIDRDTGTHLFTPNTILNKGNLRIGVIGLTGIAPQMNITLRDPIKTIPWQQVLPEMIATLTPNCDMLILLSSLNSSTNREIALAHKEISVIIQSHNSSVNLPPKQINNTLICQTGHKGKHIGIMKINWQNPVWQPTTQTQLKNAKKQEDKLLWQLGKYRKGKNPDEKLKKHPDHLKTYNRLVSKLAQIREEILELEKNRKEKNSRTSASTFENQFIALATNLPDHEKVLSLVEEIKKGINE